MTPHSNRDDTAQWMRSVDAKQSEFLTRFLVVVLILTISVTIWLTARAPHKSSDVPAGYTLQTNGLGEWSYIWGAYRPRDTYTSRSNALAAARAMETKMKAEDEAARQAATVHEWRDAK